eukprot:6698935-Heterocapsa_arctica.AAC.1
MFATVKPGFLSFGPRVAHIPASLVERAASFPERSATQHLIATASGSGSVTSTPAMLSPARDLPRSVLVLAER